MKKLRKFLSGSMKAVLVLGGLLAGGEMVRAQCDPPPSGLVAWWQGEGNGNDTAGTNNASVTAGVNYAPAEVGQGFSLNGQPNWILAPDAPQLNFSSNQDFSIEVWIQPLPNPGNWQDIMTVVGKRVAPDTITQLGYEISLQSGVVYFQMADVLAPYSWNNFSGGPDLRDGKFHHVAVTVQRNSATGGQIYIDGQVVTTFDPTMCPGDLTNPGPLRIGNHPVPGLPCFYNGLIDEVSLYNRALTAGEITGVYNAGHAGKCPLGPMPPVITSQPANQSVAANGSATFSVTAGGSPTLSYQWSCDGTPLVGATNAVLSLANVQVINAGTYDVTVTNLYGLATSSNATLTVFLPPAITQQPQSQMVLSYNPATFTVAATGTGPLSYQWLKNGTNLFDGGNVSGSATATLSLAVVSTADAGNYSVLVSNSYASTNSAVAVLTVPETVISLGATTAMSGTTVTVPVWMNALGLETIYSASVSYDPTKLVFQSVQLGGADANAYLLTNTLQAVNGYVGFSLSFSPVIPAGIQEVALLVFQAQPVTTNTTVNLTFGDYPTPQQLVDNDANLDALPMITQNSTVTLVPAEYEADVYPRTGGDHKLTAQDWAEVGRMVAGLEVPTNSDEFLRADCSPRGAPDGVLTVADWVQAGRYQAGLDPLTLVPVPNPETNFVVSTPEFKGRPLGLPAAPRILQVVTVSGQPGQSVNVPVQLICITNENAVGLTVTYNPALLTLTNVLLGANMPGGRFNVNSNLVAGKVGLALALSPGQALTRGTNQVAVLQFVAAANAANTVPLTVNSSLVVTQVADNGANALVTSYVNGAVTFPSTPTVQLTQQNGGWLLSWPVGSGPWTYQLLSADTLTGPWRTNAAVFSTNGGIITTPIQTTNQQQYFRLEGQ